MQTCWMMRPSTPRVLECVRMSKGIVSAFICEVKQCEHRAFVFPPALLPDGRVHGRDCGGLPALLPVKHSSVTLFEGPACRQRNQAGLSNLLLQRVTFCLQTGGAWLHQLLRFSIIIHRVYCPLKHFITYQN